MMIGVIGGGVVGRATARAFMEWADVRVYDKLAERRTHSLVDTLQCDMVFVCLPTPQSEGRLECYTGHVETFFACHRGTDTNFVLRSTVPIGTTRRLAERFNLPNLVHSPEFLTARCAVTDAQLPARNIIGKPVLTDHSPWCALFDLYQERFPGVPIYGMTSDESEAIKLIQNSFFAVKVAFFNEARALADRLSLDWDRILAAVLADGRIAHAHTRVPGPDGKRGFGGTCLPKDLANFIACQNAAGTCPVVSQAAHERNNLIDRC